MMPGEVKYSSKRLVTYLTIVRLLLLLSPIAPCSWLFLSTFLVSLPLLCLFIDGLLASDAYIVLISLLMSPIAQKNCSHHCLDYSKHVK